jgi:hypothetical protein
VRGDPAGLRVERVAAARPYSELPAPSHGSVNELYYVFLRENRSLYIDIDTPIRLTQHVGVNGLAAVLRTAARPLATFLLSAAGLAASNVPPTVSITAPNSGQNFVIPSSVNLEVSSRR